MAAMGRIRVIGRSYKRIRKELIGPELTGIVIPHDHPVGVVGEFWARYFYETERHIRTVLPDSPVAGYDFRAGKKQVSVKSISDWSVKRHQGPLRGDSWAELCLVHLSERLEVVKLGVASRRMLRAKAKFGKRVALRWIEPGGCIDEVYEWANGTFRELERDR